MKNIEIHHSIVYDFLFSLLRFSSQNVSSELTNMYSEDLMEKFKSDDFLTKWYRNKVIPEEYQETINTFFNNESRWHVLFTYYVRFNNVTSVDMFIDLLKEKGKKLFSDFVYFFGKHSPRFPDISEKEADKLCEIPDKAMEYIEQVPFTSQRKWELLQLCNKPDFVLKKLIKLINWYWNEIFSVDAEKIEKSIIKQEKDLRQKLNKYGAEYFDLLMIKNRKRNKKISLAITYFGELGYSILFNDKENHEFYIIGYRHMDVFVERKHPLLSNVLIFKALGDETRQNMIKLLSEKEWYGDELAQRMGLSNSTVSYHFNILLLEGFVTLKRVDNRTYISLNKKRLEKSIKQALGRMLI